MSILAKMGDWQVRGFAWAGAEVGGGGTGEGAGRGRRRGRALAQGRRVVGEARPAAPRRVPGRERGREDARRRRPRRRGQRALPAGWALGKVRRTLQRWPPGEGSLVVCEAAPLPPSSVETGLDD